MKQGKAKKIILIIIILLLIILGGYAYAYLATDIFKTPEELFTKYLANNVEQLKDFNLKPFDETIKKMVTDPAELNIDVNCKSDEPEVEVKLDVNVKSDPVNKKESFTMEMKNNGNHFLAFDSIVTSDAFGIHVKELHDKYITVENRDLKKLAETFGLDEETIDQIPDKIPEGKVLSDEDIETLKNLKEKYCKRILEQIDSSYYSVEKDVTVNVNGTDIKANKYALTMSEKEFLTIILNTLDELIADPDFVGLYENDSQLDEIKEQIEKLKEEIDELGDETVVIAVYEENKKAVKTEFVIDEDKAEFIVNNDSIIINVESDLDSASIVITNTFDGTQGDLSIEFIDNDDNDNNVKVTVKSTKNDDNVESTIELEGEEFEESELKYDISFSIKFNPNLEIDDLTNSNSIVINDYTQEDFTELFMEIMANITKSVEEEPYSFVGTMYSYVNRFSSMSNANLSNLDSNTSNLYNEDNNDRDSSNETIRFGDLSDTDMKKASVESEIKTALENKLLDYHMAAISNEEENPADYLTIDKIQEECNSEYKLELIDGNTIKCTLDNDVFYAKISIDGNEWELTDIEVLYSEDGTLESAR